MPFKKFSRRILLAADSALASLYTPFVRALPVRRSVDINDHNPHDRIALFKQTFSEGQTVVVPAGLACDSTSTGISISTGKTLHILGGLCGDGRGWFILQDDSQVTGEEGGNMHSITLDARGSDCTIKGLTTSGFGPVTQIYIGGKDKRVMCNLAIDNFTVSHANYAILRQGFHSQIIGANIVNCEFDNLQGNAIERNVAINDSDILISDHVIGHVNYTNGKTDWGIDIGLAGGTYDNNYPGDQIVKSFVVTNITGSDCRQLIHVRNSRHFVIHNVRAYNITPNFSKGVGIDNATVAIYGCDNFVIDSTEMINSARMLIGYRIIKGKCLSIPQGLRVNNIQLDNIHLAYKLHDIQIFAGSTVSFVTPTNIEVKHMSLELHNRPRHLFMWNIKVMQGFSVGPALSMNFDMRKDVHGISTAEGETSLSLANVYMVNEGGRSSVDIDRISHHIVNAKKVNFRLPEWRE